MSRYEHVVRALYQVNAYQPAKMGLGNISALHACLGSPMQGMPAVHIAGTNGKGSVAFKMAKALEAAGYRTGLFVSPHVSCFRERMQINGVMIPEESVVRHMERIFSICETEHIPATFFELTTAMAFAHFREARAQVAVVEAGLGGRLDATNIITPSLSIITSVGLDHTKILGDTIEAIATDKAGVIKPGIPILVGDNCPIDLLKGIARERGAPFHRVHGVPTCLPPPLPPSLGVAEDERDFDEENSRLAAAGLSLLNTLGSAPGPINDAAVLAGIAKRPPCRFEVLRVAAPPPPLPPNGGAAAPPVTVTVILDVAHNPPAVRRLAAKLRADAPGRALRFIAATLAPLLGGRRPHVGGDGGGGGGSSDASVGAGVRAALAAAARAAAAGGPEEVVVVCGSVFIMAEARRALGFDEPQDSHLIAEVLGQGFSAGQDNLAVLNQAQR
ncbi:Mur ligase [Tribonema minus]|uniref:Mur ligase n=1 Tax=Tribonema minus TaxID=303371 RepID=A0A835ZCG7_9STRA|nr:Mur ligase [Tribonema minus]